MNKGTTFYFTIPYKPVKEMKPIKLLFSSQEGMESKMKLIFQNMLGPLGEQEFEELKNATSLNRKETFKYIDSLVKKGILSPDRSVLFKESIKMIMAEKSVSSKEKINEEEIAKFFKKRGGD